MDSGPVGWLGWITASCAYLRTYVPFAWTGFQLQQSPRILSRTCKLFTPHHTTPRNSAAEDQYENKNEIETIINASGNR